MTAQPPTAETGQLTSTVIVVVLRVAGAVITDVRPHAIGTPQRQAIARIGDVLPYLTDHRTVARIRQQRDAAKYIATKRLPETVLQTWLVNPHSNTYPLGETLRLGRRVDHQPVDSGQSDYRDASAPEGPGGQTGLVGSAWGAVSGFLRVRFSRPPAEPDVRVSTHPALHESCAAGLVAVAGQGEGIRLPRQR